MNVKTRCYGYLVGHPIYSDDNGNTWYYVDTDEYTGDIGDRSLRDCSKCKLSLTEDGHDPCIANIPGVKYACCGHGLDKPYLMLNDKTVWNFKDFDEIKQWLWNNLGYKTKEEDNAS